jgi:hypothetical protein
VHGIEKTVKPAALMFNLVKLQHHSSQKLGLRQTIVHHRISGILARGPHL